MSDGCVICGKSPVVKSHLMPRALMLDIRGEEKTLIAGNRFKAEFSTNKTESGGAFCVPHTRRKSATLTTTRSNCFESTCRKPKTRMRAGRAMLPIQNQKC